MRVDLLTREYPPHVYGGAGVHVTELAKVLRPRVDDLRVQAFDGPREGEKGVFGYEDLPQLAQAMLRFVLSELILKSQPRRLALTLCILIRGMQILPDIFRLY